MRSTLALAGLALLTLSGCAAARQMAEEAVGGLAATPVSGVTWDTDAAAYRAQIGRRYAYTCPSGGSPSAVWGSGPYTDDSSVCGAAVHAGAITRRGGSVVIEMRAGQGRYAGSSRNGVETLDYGSWEGSFAVVR